MTYTAIPDTDIDAESPITESLLTLMRDNPIAIANGDSGAPEIQTEAIAAAAIGRSEIANSTTTAAGSIPNAASISGAGISLNNWALFPMIHTSNAQVYMTGATTDGGSASAPRFNFYNASGATRSYDVDHRWITDA